MLAANALADRLGVTTPVLLVIEERVRANIARMAAKAAAAGVRLRPHAKTHQSLTVARWCREAGVDSLTVSSLGMAAAFAADGWNDITVAVPFSPREAGAVRELAGRMRLGLLADHPAVAAAAADCGARVWLKIDVGYGRAGVRWDDAPALTALALAVPSPGPAGILTHAGQSYAARGRAEVLAVHAAQSARMAAAHDTVAAALGRPVFVSIGDTPTCRTADAFPGIDELRPGNFVYYDRMQFAAGICGESELAAFVLCPVVGVHDGGRRLVLHAGAVHLSKERDGAGYGCLVEWDDPAPGRLRPDLPLVSLSQELAVVADGDGGTCLRPGDAVLVAPVHSCLAADLLPGGVTSTGRRLASAGLR
jgi:D-serine deaminase-like pyridoxal phosphate-dependent protein